MMYHNLKEAINEARKNGGDLVIPDGVKTVTEKMFAFVNDIISVTVPKTVKEIEDFAFCGCDLETIIIPEGIKLGEDAFSFILNLRKIVLVHENGTRTIKKWVITRGDDIDPSPDGSIVIPEGVTDIEDYTFSDCTSLKSVVIPESVTQIGNGVFSGCTSLESVVIPESVTQIGDRVFSDCTSLKSVVIPESVTQIGDEIFNGCTSLESVVIPESVTQIGNGVFSDCTSLKSVVIPESVTQIGEFAFSDCTSLKSVDISSGTNIGFNAFNNTNIVQMTEAMLESFKTKCCECGETIDSKKDRCLKIMWSGYDQHKITYACSECGGELSTRDISDPCAFCDGYDCCSCTVKYEDDGMASPEMVESMEWIEIKRRD